MDTITIFWMQILTSVLVFGIGAAWYVWPPLTKLSRNSALIPLLFVQVPRYVGMTLFIPYMVDPKLSREFVSNAAYGDLLEAALAFASIFALRGNWRVAIPLVWVANRWGFIDLLKRLRGVLQLNVPSFNLGGLPNELGLAARDVIDRSVYNMLNCFRWRDRDNSTRIKLWIGPCVCSGSMATTPHRCET